MANTTLERAETKIEEQAARYRELAGTRRTLRARIEKAEAEKRSVKERVFRRVHDEYRQRLDEVERELEPIAAEIQNARGSLEKEVREIDVRLEEIQDQFDEIGFRHRVGEYDADSSNRLREPLSDEHSRAVERRRALTALLVRLDERGGEDPEAGDRSRGQTAGRKTPERETAPIAAERGRTSEPADVTPPRATPAVATPPRATPTDVTPPRATPDAVVQHSPAPPDAFVDPTEWVGEFVEPERTNADKPAARAASQNDAAENLSDLADPSDDPRASRAGESSRGGEQRIDLSDTLPILTVVSGPAAGKRLPLLPMTMTLGREVDNNIEIKDSDVARYHARISFEGGHYTIQDLEGSSGTFVNGQRISKTVLAPGASIRVGSSELRLELG